MKAISITPEIEKAYAKYLDESIDYLFNGAPVRRRDTYPYNLEIDTGLATFAAGYQIGKSDENR